MSQSAATVFKTANCASVRPDLEFSGQVDAQGAKTRSTRPLGSPQIRNTFFRGASDQPGAAVE